MAAPEMMAADGAVAASPSGEYQSYRLPLPGSLPQGAVQRLPLVDKAGGYAMGPMATGIRITTGAELTGLDALATPVQLASAEASARELIDLGKRVEPDPWFGTRPCTPDMLPVLGPAPRHPGLWMNFGHGHQGFTLGPATGRLLAEMMSGETPAIDPTPYRPERF